MVPAYHFDKAKLPRGMSFPLKRSALDAALAAAGVSKILCVYYWRRQGGHNVLRADYCGEGHREMAAAGLASITVYAVPSEERQATERALLSEVLPAVMRWLGDLERAGNTRRGVDQYFVAAWQDGVVRIDAS
jgi:hypothetical protein